MMRKLNKKGASIKDSFLLMLIGVFGFIVVFNFISANAAQSGIDVPQPFLDAYSNASESLDLVESLSNDFQNVQNVTEAEGDNPGYFGLRGILRIMKLPFELPNIVWNFVNAIAGTQNYIPLWIINIALVGLITMITFAGIAFLANRAKEP